MKYKFYEAGRVPMFVSMCKPTFVPMAPAYDEKYAHTIETIEDAKEILTKNMGIPAQYVLGYDPARADIAVRECAMCEVDSPSAALPIGRLTDSPTTFVYAKKSFLDKLRETFKKLSNK